MIQAKKMLCITLNPAIDLTLQVNELQLGAVNRQQYVQSHAAGKGLNVAQILRDLGHDVIVTGFLGQANRQIFDTHCQAQGFDSQFIYVDGETRQNIKISEQSGRMTDINGKGFVVSTADKSALLQQCERLAKQADYVVIAGSLPQNFSLADFEQLVRTIQGHQSKIAIDTSGEALIQAIQLQPWLIKPNTDELYESFQQDVTTLAQQKALFAQMDCHIEHIVISMGEQGVNWLNHQQDLHAKPPRVQVKSTVGAGDTLLAGMVHGLSQQYDFKDILCTATALASHAVTQIGFGIPSIAQRTQLEQQTQVIAVSHE
ncbi:MAG: 1-phosphofructokinase [Acinetobacter sp.]|nr:1-phosphofructokinase [Acinetobacter sp.]